MLDHVISEHYLIVVKQYVVVKKEALLNCLPKINNSRCTTLTCGSPDTSLDPDPTVTTGLDVMCLGKLRRIYTLTLRLQCLPLSITF